MNDHTTPTQRAGLRDEIAAVLARFGDVDQHAMADAVLPVLYREWPWLRAEAEDAAPADRAALVRACASFVRDTYSGEWADDAAATLETDADKIERGEPCSLLRHAAVLPATTNHDTDTDALLPAWEAVYEPGNVSDYLIGYANAQVPATAMAEAWLRSQAEVTGRLEWVDDEQMATGRYDRWFELIERHDDGVDTGPGIVVRRRVADETAATETPEWDRPETEEEKLAKCRRMAKAMSAPPVAPPEWETTTEWPDRHKRPGDRRVHATARFIVNDTQRFWTACGEHVGSGGTPMSHMPVNCRGCKRATAAGARQDGAQQ